MAFIQFSRKSDNELEKIGRQYTVKKSDDESIVCPNCHRQILKSVLEQQCHVCSCGHHFRLTVQQRLDSIVDFQTFVEHDAALRSDDILGFPNYEKKLTELQHKVSETEAVTCGVAKINGYDVALFVMNSFFMMGSMGTAVGEKITRLFEFAAECSLPVIGFTASGGARMQEGLLSLMQMAKTSGAVKRHSDEGLLYIAVLTDPTTGGVTASFAMEGDIILAEPGATVGFAGQRVIKQTTSEELPAGFQTAEFMLEHGFIDAIVPRCDQKKMLTYLLNSHQKGGVNND